ncbi:uncharacterized protein LOC117570843 [Drosophila albomicans]|uniref:Uncharacterized protein LOC117570843 n=1 Tax=Drosophila albomicans TaxID=7291 RepID=A0A6P8XB81_DROAB|nr:uncharacterized protein LOC117570843 [Drosophila albomicans]
MKDKDKKTCFDDRQNFVATRMSLPLFMVSRNRIREDNLDSVQKQFKLAGAHYNSRCQQENRGEEFSSATYAHYKHLTGFEKQPAQPYPEQRPLKCDRSLSTWRSYHQAPNRYGVLPEPYKSRMGSKGSVFAKMHVHKSRVSIKPPGARFYEMPSEIERFFKPENKQKGIFLSNARDHRPSTRAMVNDLTTCWRNPDDPGPTDTYTNVYEINANMKPVIKTTLDNPHLFLPQSCIPTGRSLRIRRNISFEPGPGRYDIRYPNVCGCERGKKTMPGLTVMIEKQKRFKFRRLPYMRINSRKYCEPDWRHVVGHGHGHIFKIGKHDKPKPQVKKPIVKGKKAEKQLKMFADGKYLNMLVNPRHFPISIRDFPVPPYVPRIVYNCVSKRVIRKQLRNNKKIAFLSGQERWKDGARPLQLTARQLEAIKERLPIERRLVDHPLELRPSKMLSRLHHVPEHMRNTYMPKLRKRLFKFLPIPGARVLVTESEITPDLHFDRENPTGMYNRKLDETQFYRDSVLFEQSDMSLVKAIKKRENSVTGSVASKLSNLSLVRQSISRTSMMRGTGKGSVMMLNPSESRARELKSEFAAEMAAVAAAEVAAQVAET